MQRYVQRSKEKYNTIMDAWNDVSKTTNLTQRSVGPAHTKHYWKWKILRVNLKSKNTEQVCK
jgi:hypothetical protein